MCQRLWPEWQSAYAQVHERLRGVVRASSAVECLNSPGRQWMPALMQPHMRDGLSALLMEVLLHIPQAFHGSPSAPRIHAQRVARFDYYCASNCLPPKELRRDIQ